MATAPFTQQLPRLHNNSSVYIATPRLPGVHSGVCFLEGRPQQSVLVMKLVWKQRVHEARAA
eukprot:5048083-Pleurochrysis_carterae.AAC.1